MLVPGAGCASTLFKSQAVPSLSQEWARVDSGVETAVHVMHVVHVMHISTGFCQP